MKTLTVVLAAILHAGVCMGVPALPDVTSILNREGGGKDSTTQVRLLPPEQQSEVLEAVVRGVMEVSRESLLQSEVPNSYVRNAAWLLSELGTDEQILRAFRNPAQFGATERDAARALAACTGSDGVAIIEALARERLPNFGQFIDTPISPPPTEEETVRANAVMLPFFALLDALAGAANPDGRKALDLLLKEFAKRYDSKKGEVILAEMTKEFARTTVRRPAKEAASAATSARPLAEVPDDREASLPDPAPTLPGQKSGEPTGAGAEDWLLWAVMITAAMCFVWWVLKKGK